MMSWTTIPRDEYYTIQPRGNEFHYVNLISIFWQRQKKSGTFLVALQFRTIWELFYLEIEENFVLNRIDKLSNKITLFIEFQN